MRLGLPREIQHLEAINKNLKEEIERLNNDIKDLKMDCSRERYKASTALGNYVRADQHRREAERKLDRRKPPSLSRQECQQIEVLKFQFAIKEGEIKEHLKTIDQLKTERNDWQKEYHKLELKLQAANRNRRASKKESHSNASSRREEGVTRGGGELSFECHAKMQGGFKQASNADTRTDGSGRDSDESVVDNKSAEQDQSKSCKHSSAKTVQDPLWELVGDDFRTLKDRGSMLQRHIDYALKGLKNLRTEKGKLGQPNGAQKDGDPRKNRARELTAALEDIDASKPGWLDDPGLRDWSAKADEAWSAWEGERSLDEEIEKTSKEDGKYNGLRQKQLQSRKTATAAHRDAKLKLDKACEEMENLNHKLLQVSNTIRTHCRIRPRQGADPLKTEIEVGDQHYLKVRDARETTSRGNERQDWINYRFDGITKHDESQEGIESVVLPLCQAVLQGKSVCIFCHGPTNSGKSYTMYGPGKEASAKAKITAGGLIYAVLDDMLMRIKKHKQDPALKIKGVEIFNQKTDAAAKGKSSLADGHSTVLRDRQAAADFVEEKHGNRRVATTKRNQASSRTHSGVIITVPRENCRGPSDAGEGKMLLLDLAGAERGGTSDDPREGGGINENLLALRRVIRAMAEGKRPSFREKPVGNEPRVATASGTVD
ncbi:MAG: hypothetical protein Q9219_005084 [cf. Caloplaca sp. 3 TL-2023]